MKFFSHRLKWQTGLFGLSLFLNLFVVLILFTPFVNVLYPYLIVDDPVEGKASTIVVLSRGANKDGEIGCGCSRRVKRAIQMYKTGVSDSIICAGGVYYPSVGKTIAQLMKDEIVAQNIPANHVMIQDDTQNTYNDLSAVIKIFGDRIDFDKAVFVTSAYHTKRVRLILDKKKIKGAVVAASYYQLSPILWSERMEIFRDVAREYGALVYFKMKGYL